MEPRERRVQAQAELGGRRRTRGSRGTSPLLVVGIVVLATSLVAIGAMVVLSSLDRTQSASGGPSPDPAPTPNRPTPGVFTVGKQDPPPGSGPTPTTTAPGQP